MVVVVGEWGVGLCVECGECGVECGGVVDFVDVFVQVGGVGGDCGIDFDYCWILWWYCVEWLDWDLVVEVVEQVYVGEVCFCDLCCVDCVIDV